MSLDPGTRLGVYEVVALIGAGGMGEVYRATDTNLGRQVAIKVLPDAFVNDSERVARFEREAKTLASLDHPNIAIIHGLEKSHGRYALVMELVEGEDLSLRIARGPMPLDEALPIATQIADALEAAHEQGIIHRDLKPANIKVRPDGSVKVLDFGLAKLNDPNGPNVSNHPNALSMSPTITSPALLSGVGVLLGTAAYMSPEQAKGLPADHRSDVFAFGCVLFEMLAGRQAFAGEAVADVLASVLARDPPWDALPTTLDPRLAEAVRRCLAKQPRQRWQAIGDLRYELQRIATEPPVMFATRHARSRGRVAAMAATIALGAALLASAAVVYSRQPPLARETRLDVVTGDDDSFALSPDGRSIVFVAARDRVPHLWLRQFDAVEARPLPGTDGATAPFWSPDARSIGFFSDAALKRVDLLDGRVQTLAAVNFGRGGAWGTDGSILFSPTVSSRLMLLTPGGTAPVFRQPEGFVQSDPEWLPDGQFLFFRGTPNEVQGLYVGGLDGRAPRKLIDAESGGRGCSSGSARCSRSLSTLVPRPSRATRSASPMESPLSLLRAAASSPTALPRAAAPVSSTG